MKPDLEAVLRDLVERNAREGSVHIDDFAEALGMFSLGVDEIDGLLERFEAAGGRLRAPEGGGGPERLKIVLSSARELGARLKRTATAPEIAEHTGLDIEQVRQALALGRVMSR